MITVSKYKTNINKCYITISDIPTKYGTTVPIALICKKKIAMPIANNLRTSNHCYLTTNV